MENNESGAKVIDILLAVFKAAFLVVAGFLWILFVFIGVDKNKD